MSGGSGRVGGRSRSGSSWGGVGVGGCWLLVNRLGVIVAADEEDDVVIVVVLDKLVILLTRAGDPG